MRSFIYFFSGLLFASGLVISGMTQPQKVIGFLDVGGQWDASLAFVMGGAVLVHSIAYRLIMNRASPFLAQSFSLPQKRDVDRRLVLGSMFFGVGWGLLGYCPGPALVSLATGSREVLLFVGSMLFAMALYSRLSLPLSLRAVPAPESGPSV